MNDIEEIIRALQRITNKLYYREKKPIEVGENLFLYRAEVHIIEAIGEMPGINVTELANHLGITKGAVSQSLKKLVQKKLVIKNRHNENDKELALYLSASGMLVFIGHEEMHKKINSTIASKFTDASKENISFFKKFCFYLEQHLDGKLLE